MKELRVYLRFLRNSLLFLIAGSLIGISIGLYIYKQQKTIYTLEQLYELDDENKSGDEKIATAEQVVGLLREDSRLNSDVQNIYISRIAPYAVKVELSSDNPQINSENLIYVSRYLRERGNFNHANAVQEILTIPSFFLYLLIGLGCGFGVGLCISLMKTYLRNY